MSTDQERSRQLADAIENGRADLGSWWGLNEDLIVRALRLLAEQGNAEPKQGNGAAVLPASLRETVEAAMRAKRAELISAPLQRIWPDLTDAALSAISAAGFVIVPREPVGYLWRFRDGPWRLEDPFFRFSRDVGPSRSDVIHMPVYAGDRAALAEEPKP